MVACMVFPPIEAGLEKLSLLLSRLLRSYACIKWDTVHRIREANKIGKGEGGNLALAPAIRIRKKEKEKARISKTTTALTFENVFLRIVQIIWAPFLPVISGAC